MSTEKHLWLPLVKSLFSDLDRHIARLGLECEGCGGCCHFDQTPHLLYASRLERLYLLETAGPPPAPSSPALAALIQAGQRCPYQVDGRCLARDGRVLGCRLHFCRWSADRDEDGFQEEWHRRLKDLHDEIGVEWQYSRLLPLLPLP